MIKMKIYHRSRKFAIVVLALIFLNSVMTLKLRGYQRRQNLNLLRSELKSESNKDIFDSIEEKSKKEDLKEVEDRGYAAINRNKYSGINNYSWI